MGWEHLAAENRRHFERQLLLRRQRVDPGFGNQGSGFRVWGLRRKVQGLGFRVLGLGV